MLDAHYCEGDEISLVVCNLENSPFNAPFFIPRSFGSDFVPDTHSVVPAPFCVSIACGCLGHLSHWLLLCFAKDRETVEKQA